MSTDFNQSIAAQHRRSQSARLARASLLLALSLTVPIAGMAWPDAAFVLSPLWRWLAFAIAAIATVFALAAAYRSLRRANQRATAAAMDASSQLPTGYVISTSAEFATATSSDPIQQAMLDRLHAEAGKLAATSQPRHPWPGKWLVSTAAAAIALAAALFLTHGTQPLLRMLLPWQALPYTQVTLAPSVSLPAKNEAFTITGTVSGRIPDDVRIDLGNGQGHRIPVAADGSFQLAFPEGIAAPTTATAFAAADGISPAIALDLRTIPTLLGYQHTITPPAYTGHPERQESHASFAVLRASQVVFSVSFDTPPKGVRMIFDNARAPLDLVPSADSPRTWQAELGAIPRTFGYQLETSDAHGTYPVEENAQQIVATPDNPPTISITESNAEKLKTRKDILTVSHSARDDIGLANIAVKFYRVGDSETIPTPIATFDKPTLEHNGDWLLPLADLNVRPLDTLIVIFEARDTNTLDGPGIGYSEPLIIEIPEDPGTDSEEPPPGEGGGPSGEITQINPLELQRQIYRDTLRTSLRHRATPLAELAGRQKEIPGHLAEMANSELANALGPQFVALLKTASDAAQKSAQALAPQGPAASTRADLRTALNHQATAINALVEAARLQMEMKSEPPPPGEGEEPPPPQTVFTLIGQNTPPKADPEAEEQEQLAKALEDLEKALEDQKKLNEEMKKGEEGEPGDPTDPSDPSDPTDLKGPPSEGPPSEGPPSQAPSTQPSTGSQGGPPSENSPDSATPPSDPSDPSDPSKLAARQLALAEFSRQIEAQIEKLRASESAADPKLAAAQMRRAAEFQRQAAEGMLGGKPDDAASSGSQSEDAIRRALIITESLLDRGVQAGIEATSQPTGYQGIIQNYSRRLSYDQ